MANNPPTDPFRHPASVAALEEVDASLRRLVYPETLSNICGAAPPVHWRFAPRIWQLRRGTVETFLRAADNAPTADDALRLRKLAKRLAQCSETVLILRRSARRLPSASASPPEYMAIVPPCNSRFCPACAIEMSRARSHALAHAIAEHAREGKLTAAVLTIPNCRAADLRRTIIAMKSAFRRLRGQTGGMTKAMPPWDAVWGGAWNLEVTYNTVTNTYHPHIHLLIHAPWIPGKKARDAWKEACAQCGITARSWRVYLRWIDPRTRLSDAIVEVSKYATKPVSLTYTPLRYFHDVTAAFDHARSHDSWGTLKHSVASKRHDSEWTMLASLSKLLRTHPGPDEIADIKRAVCLSPVARTAATIRHSVLDLIPFGGKTPCAHETTPRPRTTHG